MDSGFTFLEGEGEGREGAGVDESLRLERRLGFDEVGYGIGREELFIRSCYGNNRSILGGVIKSGGVIKQICGGRL